MVRTAPLPTPLQTILHDPSPLADSCLRSCGRVMTRRGEAAGAATSGRSDPAAEDAPSTSWCRGFVCARSSCIHMPCGGAYVSGGTLELFLGCDFASGVQVSVSITCL